MAYRVRKEGGIFSSIFGMLIGIGFVVIASPLAAWYAESQHRAEDFSEAAVVDATGSTEGYIVIEGDVTNESELLCPQPAQAPNRPVAAGLEEPSTTVAETTGSEQEERAATNPTNCVAVQEDKEEYQRTEKEICSQPTDDQTIIQKTDIECDDDGSNCEQCYLVEEFNWTNLESTEDFATFTLGSYSVTPSSSANLIGSDTFTQYQFAESQTAPLEGDLRTIYTFLPSDQRLLVAGDAESKQITAAYEKRPYVISNLSYQGTLEALAAQDKGVRWTLRIVSLLLMVGGMVMIFGPLTMFTNVFRFIPGVGKHLDRGFDSVLKFAAAVIGFLLWIVVYGVVLVLKNIFLVIIVLAAIGGLAFFLVKRGKAASKAGSQGSASNGPTSPSTPSQPAAPVEPKQNPPAGPTPPAAGSSQ